MIEHASPLEVAEDVKSAVIHAMRRMEVLPAETRKRGEILEHCRAVIGASTLLIAHIRDDGDLAMVHVAGAPPTRATIGAIQSTSQWSRQWFSAMRRVAGIELVIAGRASDVVCAVLQESAEPWVEDFVAFIAARLIRGFPATVHADNAVPDGGLVLPPEMIVGSSAGMRDLLQEMAATICSGLDVLLSGETGTGKELFARIVHRSGPKHSGPFVAINCAAIPTELLEAELFGVERRVATGVDPRAGLFIAADGGTVFLDEIGDLEDRLQAKILRVLQEREVLAVGATRPRRISVRIVSASNRNLAELVARGRFRADLYYRLHGLEFHIPPLRCRVDDIPLLALEFLSRASEQHGKRIAGITHAAIELLKAHPWPGNVRELQSEVHRAVLLCASGDSVGPEHFALRAPILASDDAVPVPPPVCAEQEDVSLRERVDATERDAICRALRRSHGNRSVAAKTLGITRNGLANKVRRLGLQNIDEP